MIDTLVMAEERRQLIKALAKNYGKDGVHNPHKAWAADYVQGKGEGKIFLLHGKPGVGKTYTAGMFSEDKQTSGQIQIKVVQNASLTTPNGPFFR